MQFPRAIALVVALVFTSQLSAADKRPMTLDDFFAVKRVAAPQISPDGKAVVYQVTEVNLKENKTFTALWLAASDGKTPPKQLSPQGMKASGPRWSPDGAHILFESGNQLHVTDLAGGAPRQLTSISTGASHGVWSPDGKRIAFVSSVYPEFSEKPFAESDKLNKAKNDEIANSPVKAKTFSKLFYRHWVEYVGDKRQHIFVCDSDGKNCRDVTPGDRDAYPTSSTFDSGDNFTFTPDSKHIVFTAPPSENESWSTNYDLCRVSIINTSPKWETLTADNKAADSGPKFSPDGKKLAWRAQKKAGYEADKWEIVVVGVKPDGALEGKPEAFELLNKFDRSINDFVWWGESEFLVTVDDLGKVPILLARSGAKPIRYDDFFFGSHSSLSASSKAGRWVTLHSAVHQPPEVYSWKFTKDGFDSSNISLANPQFLTEFDVTFCETASVTVEGNTEMQMWVLKPPGFDEKKKYPIVYLVHGGPQSAWRNAWSARWNPKLWAAQGYVVVMPNPRGSVGFGQKFTDEITGDWGGKCYRDLIAGLDYVEQLPYVDKDRIAAAGGSFGGYMMNWFAVNDIAPRFKCLITHCSVWNFESMWGTTDELWFDEWEHGGLPWEKPAKYAEFSPHKKAANLGKYKAPMLIIHNDLDFRCPIGQGHELFTALQRQGVPSRFVNFPDEGHWVLKPRNSEHWHKEIFAWLKKYAPPGGR